ncbi:MAG: GNAT family N-acetyltransferase [Candidatus Aureabacteria bacterium]|nr:GNAT family N-acetyltransferase [Candidatus Auribacterota bacterium]
MILENEHSIFSVIKSGRNMIQGFLINWPQVLRQKKISQYRPHVSIVLERPNYIIKTAENSAELEEIFELRHSIFYEEMLGKHKFNHVDVDAFDMFFDHLLILDKKTKKIVGTYRLNSSLFSEEFYSEMEFEIHGIKKLPGRKLELGRACVHKNFRNGIVFSLLWKGIWEYIAQTFTRYVFGCSSISSINHQTAALVYLHLKRHHLAGAEFRIYPREEFRIKHFNDHFHFARALISRIPLDVEQYIPPLLQLYLKHGAKICGEPAFDQKMRCIDFFTLIDINAVDQKMSRLLSR